MSDELLEEGHRGDWPNPHLLAYDFFKHVTSLSIVTLGGILTLSGSIFENSLDTRRLLMAMTLVAASGVIAFAAQVEMVDWANRGTGKPRLLARWGRGLVALTYGAGVGAFLSTAQRALS